MTVLKDAEPNTFASPYRMGFFGLHHQNLIDLEKVSRVKPKKKSRSKPVRRRCSFSGTPTAPKGSLWGICPAGIPWGTALLWDRAWAKSVIQGQWTFRQR
ncbi:MAG: hypothetical protein EA390_06945 [Balneolaceae bacterium]|nr:MAG: hypothetical protein EA390_06945 [Balneolaceae bacterium]